MATLQFKRGTAFIDPEIGEPFLDTSTNALKIGIGGNDFITILDSGSLDNATSGFNSRLDSIELTTASLNTSVSNLNSFTQSFNTAISLDSSNVTILGNLDVQGTTTIIDSTTITLGDNIIELNGTGAANGGILVNDVTNPNTLSGSLLWDGANDYWKAGQLGSENEIITTANIVSNLPTGTISGSSQIDHDQTTNYSANEHFTQENITTVGTVTSGNVTAILPSGLVSGSSQIEGEFLQINGDNVVSGSSQIDVTQTTNYSSINQYSDTKVKTKLDAEGVISGSSQIDHDQTTNYLANEHFTQENITTVGTVTVGSVTAILPSGTVSGSSQIDITGGLPSGTVSGSSQVDVTQTTNYSSINQYTDSDFDTRFGTKSTTDLSEGTNKYYTDSKVKTKLDVEGVISGSSQVDVTQTTNYSSINQYTDSDTQVYIDSIGLVSGSVTEQLPLGVVSGSSQIDVTQTTNYSSINQYTDSDFDTRFGTKSTTDLSEGTNEYYTDTKVKIKLDTEGVISGSSQVDVTQTTNYSSINQYTDSDTQDYLDSIGVVSGSISGQLPSGTVSGSSQIDHDQTTNYSAAEHYTQENITTLGTVTTGNIDSILPTGTVSGSSQVDVTQTTNYSSINQYTDSDFDTRFGTKSTSDLSEGTNEYYTDTKVKTKLDAEGVISGSSQVDVTQTTNYSSINQYTDSDTQNYIDSIGLISGSVSGQLPSGTVSGSSQIDHDQTLNFSTDEHFTQENITTLGTVTVGSVTAILPSGTVSGSSQIDITGGLPSGTVSGSSQIDHDQTTNFVTNEHIDHSSVSITAGSGLTGGGNITISRTLNVGAGDGINVNVDDIEVDSTVARTNQDNNFSSLQTFNDITVNGTGSFAYIEQVTGSAKIIGDAFLILNNDTPTERYAGIKVLDSGSVLPTTASLQYDGQTNDWFYEYEDNGTPEHGIMMFGPEYSTIGAPTYLTNNTIPKADGGHHFNDSNITDNGSTITLDSTLYVTQSRVGIGTTSPAAKLDIKESSNAAGDAVIRLRGHGLDTDNTVLGALEFFNADSSGDQPGVVARVEAQSGNANGHMGELVFKTHDGSEGGEGSSPKENMRLDATGNLFVSGTIFAQGDVVAFATSDKRLKDNLTQIVTPLSKLSQINGYTFDWNNEKQHIYKGKDYGVVAQEIQEVLPELVKERENGYLAVNYEKMVPLLIESIKELKTQVEYLNKKLENK